MKYGTVAYYKQELQQFLPCGRAEVNIAFITYMRIALKDKIVELPMNLMSAYDEIVKCEDD